MYKVIKAFADIKDKYHQYKEGDTYPRDGADTDNERIAELSSSDNLQKAPLIEEVKEKTTAPKKTAKEKKAK